MLTEQQAADQTWDALIQLASLAAKDQDRELYEIIYRISDAVRRRGLNVPGTGLFIKCPVCEALPGQLCITKPGHPVRNDFHPERQEACDELIRSLGLAKRETP